MAISVNWGTKVISVPKADMLLIQSSPTEIRQLDLNAFRLELKDLEDGDGMPFLDTHNHNPPVTVGGVTLARVIEIINGYTITFEDDQYAVNLVGANSNVADVTNVNQVSVRSANSAGLTYSKEIEDQSYVDARIWINTDDGSPGSSYPRGTATDPVDNYADAETIRQNRNLPKRFFLHGMITFSLENLMHSDWLGGALTHDTIALGGSTTADAIFESLMITGAASGVFTALDCVLMNVSGFNGFLFGGAIGGTLTCEAGEVHLVNTHAAASGDDFITIDYDGKAISMFLVGWEGNVLITNHSHANTKTAIDAKAGKVTLDSSCTAGTIVVRGNIELVDNSAGATVTSTGLINPDISRTLDLFEADEEVRAATYRRLHKTTKAALVTKNVTQSGSDIDLVEPP